ncbi:uncharacterized protein DDB_G0283449-like [Ruditapes philippinarum]|uniref:uncharacterized protein DDB_G0283449-like n=1 Tax=Ruditapes philippinarum TaxID=129788 RepID=UPI00295A8889|nr:uncharacterized protein DDB_G0283449-like [Ruditapes philippinarum]
MATIRTRGESGIKLNGKMKYQATCVLICLCLIASLFQQGVTATTTKAATSAAAASSSGVSSSSGTGTGSGSGSGGGGGGSSVVRVSGVMVVLAGVLAFIYNTKTSF